MPVDPTGPVPARERVRLSVDVSAVPANPVGAGRYTLELVSALTIRPDVDLQLWSRRDDRRRWRDLAPSARVVGAAPSPRPARLAWEQVGLPLRLARSGIDVHHGPHYTMPEHTSVPVVVTVHDLSFFEAPQWHERSKVVLFRRAIAVAARRAAVIVCPSQVTADDLARWCRIDGEIIVAHHGVDAARFTPIEPVPGGDAGLLGRLEPGLVGPDGSLHRFVVFVGTLEPRKDVPNLVRAFDKVASRHPDVRLVLAGGDGWGAEAVRAAVAAVSSGSRVLRIGYVPDAAVPALLRSAAVVAYPALYEGFGLPALDALACGAPLVTTSGTAMEEVAGPAAVLVPPEDTLALADALDELLEAEKGEDGRIGGIADRRRRGFEIAARHTWAASAERHLLAYRAAAG